MRSLKAAMPPRKGCAGPTIAIFMLFLTQLA